MKPHVATFAAVALPEGSLGEVLAYADHQGLVLLEPALTEEELRLYAVGDGVWRTIRGRRVFIRHGETPEQAIERSKNNEPQPPKEKEWDGSEYKKIKPGEEVDGREVLEDVPNTSSLSGLSSDWGELPGLREVPVAAFDPAYRAPFKDANFVPGYSPQEKQRRIDLAAAIKESKQISPLIVVIDDKGPYVLEGSHRFDALLMLKAKSFPALVAVDYESAGRVPSKWKWKFDQEAKEHAEAPEPFAIDFQAMARSLDALEDRARRDLREVLTEWRDGLVKKVTKAAAGDGLSRLAADLRLPRRGDFTVAMNEALRRAWERGSKDARREVREARRSLRELAFDPNQLRAPAGTSEGGQWIDVYHGTVKKFLDSIRAEGLKPGQEKQFEGELYKGERADAIFVTSSLSAAQQYAWEVGQRLGSRAIPVVVKLRVPKQMWDLEFKHDSEGPYGGEKYFLGSLGPEHIQGAMRKKANSHDWTKLFTEDEREEEVEVYVPLALRAPEEVFSEEQEERLFAGSDSTFTPRAALRWLGEKAFWITSITGDRLLNEARGVILQSIKTGRPLGETILALSAVFAPYIGDESVIGDEKQAEPYRLETIIRTNTTDAYNHGRLTEFVNKDMIPFLVGVRYSAIMDERTTEVCRFLDGRVFKPQEDALEQLLPPNHFNCRSVVVPIVVGEQVPAGEFITPAQIGEAKSLADAKFLSLHVDAWKAYREGTPTNKETT